MKRRQVSPELLAPAGDMSALMAAISAGADAIYVGGKKFGARAYAKNFTDEELKDAVKICHVHGVRLYVTLNTLVFDKEISEALEYAKFLHGIGIDALIIADVGLASLIRERIPALELHASTQMGAHNSEGVNFAAALGCKRVVLARECSRSDIEKIVENSNAECEVFLHGALCVCHSGQCLFSSMVGGRSGNRGECAQPCRLPYNNGKYPLSLKDLSLANHVRELIKTGVSSLKIEGRMKSPDYVYEVTSIYRRLLDEERDATLPESKRLMDVFSRDGFTDGYFTGKLFSKMTGVRTDGDKKASRELGSGSYEVEKLKIKAKASFKRGEKSALRLYAERLTRWDNRSVTAENQKTVGIFAEALGEIPAEAENAPLTDEGLCARLCKMGSTPFSLIPEDIEIELDGGLNLPPSAINALRREASSLLLEKFAEPIDSAFEFSESGDLLGGQFKYSFASGKKIKTTSQFFNVKTLNAVYSKSTRLFESIDLVFVPLFDFELPLPETLRSKAGVALPAVVMEHEWNEVKAELIRAAERGAKYALLENVSQLALVSGAGLTPVLDFRLNIANEYTKKFYSSLGVDNVILSPELTLPQARDIGGAVITLGRIPLMITERCFTKENFGCERCGKASFTDRRGAKFPLMREYSHRNIIFNSAPTYMGDKENELRSAGIDKTHFIFGAESFEECMELLSSYNEKMVFNKTHRRIGKR